MHISLTQYILAAICATAPALAFTLRKSSILDHIPSVGYSSWLGSYISAFKFLRNAAQILQEGYAKHKETPFKVPTLNGWIVVIGRHHLEDIQKSTDDELSFMEAASDLVKADYLLAEIKSDPYHISVARTYLTRNVGLYYPNIKDEVHTAFEELLDLKGNAWKSVPAVKTMREIICRASNRVFVGLPLCRDPDWIDLNSRFAVDVGRDASILNMFPDPLVPSVSPCMFTSSPGQETGVCTAMQWTLDSVGDQLPAIHWLSSHHSRVSVDSKSTNGPLREEVEAVIQANMGWIEEAHSAEGKVDSFLAETLRLQGVIAASVQRKAMKDLTLSDGTFIPKGTHLFVPTAVYEDPGVFDPFRFSQLCDDGNENARHQMVGATQDYLSFGYGKHICPGRYLAANELKTMLAHILTSYDVKFEDRVSRPISMHWELHILADPTVKVMFRRRTNN
ncbi:cytochrome P450 [Pisolithus marmoratus]|nr:cytochrome P450 [Pisolithus marmoratus]